jgi:oxalate decarboxylase/phosphoglucose isomerase-like protein (cupin superfamily)
MKEKNKSYVNKDKDCKTQYQEEKINQKFRKCKTSTCVYTVTIMETNKDNSNLYTITEAPTKDSTNGFGNSRYNVII